MKQWLVWIFLFLSLLFGYWSYSTIEYETKEQNLTAALQQKITPGYLDRKILKAIEDENFDDVAMYQGLAKFLDIGFLPTTVEKIASRSGFLERSLRNGKAFASGFVSGDANSVVGMAGSITSDLTLYGDLRDLYDEGSKYVSDEPYDAFILNLSMVGVGLSLSQLLTAGASTPLKVGASVLKVSKKSGSLTQPFSKELSTRLAKSVDTKILKNIEFKNVAKLEENVQTLSKSIDLKPVKPLLDDVSVLKNNTSMTDTIALMKYVESSNDLKKLGKISTTYKTHTKGVMTVLGKSALRAGKTVVKFTTKYMMKLVGLVVSLLGFLITIVLKVRSLTRFKCIVS